MKKNIALIGVALLLIISSCTTIKLKLLGIKRPQVESNESLTEFLMRGNVQYDKILHVDSINSYTWLYDSTKSYSGLEIYNSSGQLLKKQGEHECSGPLSAWLDTVDLYSLRPLMINTGNINSQLAAFEDQNGNKIRSEQFKPDEIIAVFYFTKYMGRLFRDTVKATTDPFRKNPAKDHVKILVVSLDMHKAWGMKNRNDDRWIKVYFHPH